MSSNGCECCVAERGEVTYCDQKHRHILCSACRMTPWRYQGHGVPVICPGPLEPGDDDSQPGSDPPPPDDEEEGLPL